VVSDTRLAVVGAEDDRVPVEELVDASRRSEQGADSGVGARERLVRRIRS